VGASLLLKVLETRVVGSASELATGSIKKCWLL